MSPLLYSHAAVVPEVSGRCQCSGAQQRKQQDSSEEFGAVCALLTAIMDPLEAVMDEVALEGLDGISIQTLWLRLRSRQPEFGLNLDPLTQQFIWSCLSRTEEIRFYLLPESRGTVALHDRSVIHHTLTVVTEEHSGLLKIFSLC